MGFSPFSSLDTRGIRSRIAYIAPGRGSQRRGQQSAPSRQAGRYDPGGELSVAPHVHAAGPIMPGSPGVLEMSLKCPLVLVGALVLVSCAAPPPRVESGAPAAPSSASGPKRITVAITAEPPALYY